jgi:hypothetical protein
MGEIKSTIDLAMEKTEGLTLSDEEKRALDEEKETRSAHAMGQRYLHGYLTLEEFIQHCEKVPEAQRRAMLSSVVGGMQIGRETFSRGLQALERWKLTETRPTYERIRNLSQKFGQALQKKRRKIKAELWTEFARRGVEGSAVEPNVEASPQWQSTIMKLEQEFGPRLEELKRTMLA